MKDTAHRQALERSTALREALQDCRLCPRRCGVDRLHGQKGYCGLDATVRWFREMVYEGEEMPPESIPPGLFRRVQSEVRILLCGGVEHAA